MVNRDSCRRCGRSLWGRRADARYCSEACRRAGILAVLQERLAVALEVMGPLQRKEYEKRLARRRTRHQMELDRKQAERQAEMNRRSLGSPIRRA
jgi:hypothetical protein